MTETKAILAIDWSQIIFDLERAGLTQAQIGVRCGFGDAAGWRNGAGIGTGRVWANNLKNIPGTQPKFHHGALLLGLWAEVMARPMGDVPKCDKLRPNRPRQAAQLPLTEVVDVARALAGVDNGDAP